MKINEILNEIKNPYLRGIVKGITGIEFRPIDKSNSNIVSTKSKQQQVTAPLEPTDTKLEKEKTNVYHTMEPISIGGQRLDPRNPADAKIIAQLQKQQLTNQPTAPQSTTMSPEQIRQAKQRAAELAINKK